MSKNKTPPAEACPCESGQPYEACCGRYHRGAVAPTPEALMRSRYSAYTMRLSLYLLMTWHPSTRPHFQDLELGERDTVWLGLKVLRAEQAAADEGVVEFVARYRVGGGRAVRLHETSRFVRENGVWFYVDGVIKPT
jgi:SEC-C motif domain protein